MHLKRLNIKGFKTFAEQTEISFHPGINAIVGPNGCGKSNLADAVRWALGEANVRHLRGIKSEDIIFYGTDNKKAQGMAFVEIIVDNNDQSLPIDYSELSISRKAFRNGESEFNLNQIKVRLKDITQLLSGTGMGKKGYSVIGQGELEQVLNGQPLERRLILEEASGIIKYRQQRDEVKTRIENTSQNMIRINDLLQEISRQKDELQVKAEKARQYQELYRELQGLEETLLRQEWFQLNKQLNYIRERIDEKNLYKTDIIRRLESAEAYYHEQEAAISQLGADIRSGQEEKQESDSRLASLKTDLKLNEERLKNHHERLRQARSDQEKYARLLVEFQKDLDEKQKNWLLEKEQWKEKEAELVKLETELEETQALLERNDKDFARQKDALFVSMQKTAEVKNNISENENRLLTMKYKSERMNERLNDEKKQIARLLNATEEQQRELREVSGRLTIVKNQREEQGKRLDEQIKERAELQTEYKFLREEEMSLSSQLKIIADMDQNLTGYSTVVKQLIQAGGRRELKGILGVLGELIRIPEGLELAIEIAGGSGLENIITDTEAHAQQAINWLKENKQGRMTFLPLDILRAPSVPPPVLESAKSMPGVLGLGSHLVSCEDQYRKALDYLLGRILIVETMFQAGKVYRRLKYPLRLVTLEGEVISVSGAISGGAKAEQRQNSPLLRHARQVKIGVALDKNRAAVNENRTLYAMVEERCQKLEREAADMKNQELEIEYKADILTKEISRIQEEMRAKQEEEELLGKELLLLTKEKEELEKSGRIMTQDEKELERQNHRLSQAAEELKNILETLQRKYEVSKERSRSYKEQVEMKRKEMNGVEANFIQLKKIRDSYLQSEQEAQAAEGKLITDIEKESGEQEELRRILIIEEQTARRVIAELERLLSEERSVKEITLEQRQEIQPLKDQLSMEEEEYRRLENSFIRKEMEQKATEDKWRESFRRPFKQEAPPDLTQVKINSMKGRLAFLKDQVELMGTVDIDVIEEYERVLERYVFLNTQRQDLESANASLRELLQQTEKTMDNDYKSFFKLADQSFRQTWTEIFAGGEASLKHEENKPALEAGLFLEVKLPGKRSQSINLLSGGEKALTCIAFIFALMRLQPVPFCLLDEIDASLDDYNLRCFTRFIADMARRTQFIIITHRQATVEIANHIYGVTMPEKGMSSILTMKFDDTDELAV